MGILDYVNALGEWVLSNLDRILISVVAVVVGYVIYKVITREVTRLKEQKRLEEHVAYTLNRLSNGSEFLQFSPPSWRLLE
ncbi:MAG: hypothetical protein ACE5L6_03955 [Candidatus Bathyarchaeia archaeon]